MQIEVALKITLDVPDAEEAAKYVDPATGETSIDFIADLQDDDTISLILYGDEDTKVLAINNKTPQQVQQILATRVP